MSKIFISVLKLIVVSYGNAVPSGSVLLICACIRRDCIAFNCDAES